MLLHYLGKLEIQIFCRYSADMEENANKLHFKCTDFNSSTRVSRVWWHSYFLRYLWVELKRAGCCVVAFGGSVKLFQQLINTTLCLAHLFSGTSSVNLFAVYPFKYKLFFIKILSSSLHTMLVFTARRNSWKLFQRCICHDAVCPSVCLSVRLSVRPPSHSGVLSRRMKLRSCGFHRQVGHSS